MDKYLGKRLDKRYELQKILGIGGMSTVYKAYDQINEKMVAIKILKEEFLTNHDFIRRFKNESKAISVLSHPNIVKINNVSFGDKIQYIVMEYIEGITLKEYIKQNATKLSWQEGAKIVKSILSAIDNAHKNNIIHRDIKPQNIIISKNEIIKVTDFGIARFTDQKNRTITEKTIGSVHYISPEQAKAGSVDAKSDIYSVGVIFYEIITGQLPFQADTPVSVALMQIQNDPTPPREILDNIPKGIEEIILKAMRKNPNKRFHSAKEMLGDILKIEQNPETIFNYNSFSEEEATKYIDVVSNNDYGDNYTRTQSIQNSFNKNKKIKAMVLAGILFFVFLLGIGTWAIFSSMGGSGQDVDVPDFIGQKASEVIANKEYKFNFSLEEDYDSAKAEGIVLNQNPKPKSKKIKENSKIILKVNTLKPLIKIPDLEGLSEEEAKSKLKELDLGNEVMFVEDEKIAKGNVIKTDPKSGNEVQAKSSVKLFISKGVSAKKIRVPNVIGVSRESAAEMLVTVGLKVSEKTTTIQSSKPKNSVVSTSPSAGAEVSEGTFIELTLSSGADVEKSAVIDLYLPDDVATDIKVNVYVDGVLDLSNSKTVGPRYNAKYKINLKGSGTKRINVDLNGQLYKVYQINFATNEVKMIEQYLYNSATAETH